MPRVGYIAKKEVIGTGKAIVNVARKMVFIIWHLLVNDEPYKDTHYRISKPTKKVYRFQEIFQLKRF